MDVKNVQIRNVPDALHRELKARAALEGQSLSEFALTELRRSLERPTRAEMLRRLDSRRSVTLSYDTAQLVRDERDAR